MVDTIFIWARKLTWKLRQIYTRKDLTRFDPLSNTKRDTKEGETSREGIRKQSEELFQKIQVTPKRLTSGSNGSISKNPTARPNSSFNASVDMGTRNSFRNDLNTSDEDYLSSTFQSNISYTTALVPSKLNFSLNGRHNQNNQTGVMLLTLPEAAPYTYQDFFHLNPNILYRTNGIIMWVLAIGEISRINLK